MTQVDVIIGDSLEVLSTLPAASYDCCVTSPPYYGLRSYLPDGVRIRRGLPLETKAAVRRELALIGVHPTSGGA